MTASETNPKDVPRIYVVSVVDQNVGREHGTWLEANQPPDEIRRQIAVMLAASRMPTAEGWAIQHCQHFGDLQLSGCNDLAFVAESARLVVEHGAVFAALLNHFDRDLDKAKTYMEDAHCGDYGDLGWYAATFANDLYHEQLMCLPDFIRNRIDWDAAGEALRIEGAILTIELDGVFHVFDSQL